MAAGGAMLALPPGLSAADRGGPRQPSWLVNAPNRQWVDLPSSTFARNPAGWSATRLAGSGNYQAIVDAWGGGILNTKGVTHGGSFIAGTFLVVFGGGHSDYAGNEVYAYGPLESDAPAWRRLTDPTMPPPQNVARVNGYPVSRHTYDTLQYIPAQNRMLSMACAGFYSTGNSGAASDLFDFAVDAASTNPWMPNDKDFVGGNNPFVAMGCFNPVTQKAWLMGNGNNQKLACWDARTGRWTGYPKDNPSIANNSRASVWPARNLMVFLDAKGNVKGQDLDDPVSPLYPISVKGDGPQPANVTIEWDSLSECFVARAAEAGRTLHFLRPPTGPASGGSIWSWTSETPSEGATPAPSNRQGTYGRFRFVDAGGIRGVLLMPTHDAPICFFKY